jgi:hypothetical protein
MTEQTIEIGRGDAGTLNFSYSPVVDITGYTITFSVAKVRGGTEKLFPQVAASVISGPAGTFRVLLTTQHTNQPHGTYYWDASRTDSGQEQVIARGPFVIVAGARLP